MTDPRILDDEGRRAGVYGKELDRPKTLVNPATGELVLLDAPDEHLAEVLDSIRELKSQLNELVGEVSAEVLRRMDRSRSWSARAGEFEITAPSDAPKTEWDTTALAVLLTELVDEGRIDREAMDAALEHKVVLNPRARGLNAIRKNPELAERIDACKTEVPNERRYVTVKRKRQP